MQGFIASFFGRSGGAHVHDRLWVHAGNRALVALFPRHLRGNRIGVCLVCSTSFAAIVRKKIQR